MDYTQFITIEQGKWSGEPCIRGMRITVRDVLENLADVMAVPELLADFLELTIDDVRASLAFAANHLSWSGEAQQDDSARFNVGLPDGGASPRLRVGSPRLANPAQVGDFTLGDD